jgi:predicted NUDIX family NTP pyrophosphohydrolase
VEGRLQAALLRLCSQRSSDALWIRRQKLTTCLDVQNSFGASAMSRKSQVSAGILAYRNRNGLEILLAHPGGPFWAKKDAGAWSIPKGLVESDDLLACARREFTEETGLVAEGTFTPLAPVKQKSGKTVHAFAVKADFDVSQCHSNHFKAEWPPRSGKWKNFPEIDKVAYFDLATAREKILTYQAPFIDELAQMLTREEAKPTVA